MKQDDQAKLRALLRRLNPNKPASSDAGIPRIERSGNSLDLLFTKLEADPYTKSLISGHIGVGKSTELLYLARRLQDRYFVMFQSVSDLLGAHNATAPNLLVFLLYQAVRRWKAELGAIPKGLTDHIARIFRASESAGETEHFLEMTLRKASFRFPQPNEEPPVDTAGLGMAVEGFLKEMTAAAGKPLLIIIDDLDKITSEHTLTDLFVNQSMAWIRLPCAIAATLPINMYFHAGVREIEQIWGDISVLDPLDVPSADYKLADPALKFYAALLEQTGGDRYFSNRQIHTLARDSGGIARDFVQLCNTAVVHALNTGSSNISDWIIKAVESHRTEIFRTRLIDEDYERLDRVDQEQAGARTATELLRDGILICTRDSQGKRSFQPHPLVKELLRKFRFRRSMAARK